jgi:hypothetical protein
MAEKKAEQFYTPPPKLGKWEGFRMFIWNSETHQFLGRTGASWGKRSQVIHVIPPAPFLQLLKIIRVTEVVRGTVKITKK